MRPLYAITLLLAICLVEVARAALPGGRYGSAIMKASGSSIYLYGGYGLGEDAGSEGIVEQKVATSEI